MDEFIWQVVNIADANNLSDLSKRDKACGFEQSLMAAILKTAASATFYRVGVYCHLEGKSISQIAAYILGNLAPTKHLWRLSSSM